jgi:hypothetical protein
MENPTSGICRHLRAEFTIKQGHVRMNSYDSYE